MNHFGKDLAFSEAQADQPWWQEVYRQAFNGVAAITSVRQDGWAQRGGIDRVVTLRCGRSYWIDEKVRRKDYGDIAIEYWSDAERRSPGWIAKDLACDYIAYAFATSGVCYLLPFQDLRRAWRINRHAWVSDHQRVEAKNPGYTTVSVAVPIDVLLDAISNSLAITWQVAV